MKASKCICIVALVAATGFSGAVLGNGTELSQKNDQASTSTDNSAAQLGPAGSATQRRSGASIAQKGTDNTAAQMGNGVNGNAAAQLNNDTEATSAPPADSDDNSPKASQRTDTRTSTSK